MTVSLNFEEIQRIALVEKAGEDLAGIARTIRVKSQKRKAVLLQKALERYEKAKQLK